MGFFGTATLVLFVLKYFDVIDISWWLVFAPFFAWLVMNLVVLFFIIKSGR